MSQKLSNFKAEFFKALAYPLRISILDALREGELTVNEISQKFSVEPTNASQQPAVLRNKNIVVFLRPMSVVSTVIREEALIERLRAQQPCAGPSA